MQQCGRGFLKCPSVLRVFLLYSCIIGTNRIKCERKEKKPPADAHPYPLTGQVNSSYKRRSCLASSPRSTQSAGVVGYKGGNSTIPPSDSFTTSNDYVKNDTWKAKGTARPTRPIQPSFPPQSPTLIVSISYCFFSFIIIVLSYGDEGGPPEYR